MRQLATIRKIKEIRPIEGADKIELCQVDGWQVVAEKGLHQVGDKVIYCEIDSFLPIKPEFEFLRKSSYRKMADGSEGFRLRTIKLKGQLSQGLILPIKLLLDVPASEFNETTNVASILGIKKYEPPIPAQLAGKVKGMFPGFIKKTDQERIQNLMEYFDTLSDVEFEATEKLDGSSCTYYWKDGQFGVCSRNLDLIEEENNTLWKMARILKIEELIAGRNIALQGEMIGEGIQGNPYKLKGQQFRLFDIWDIDHQRHFTSAERFDFIKDSFVVHVPTIEAFRGLSLEATKKPLKLTLEELLKLVEGETAFAFHTDTKSEREGVVFKSFQRVNGQIISFKVINNKYLLTEKC